MKTMVLLSGGIDSTSALARALRDGEVVETVTFLYGQKHSRELEAAAKISEHYEVLQHVVKLEESLFAGFGSTLIDPDKPNPRLSYEAIRKAEGPSPTYIPFRNANFISAATSLALVRKADYVSFAAHTDDAHNWAYPDCTPEFIGAMANAVLVGTYNKVRLRTPLMWMTKAEIIQLGSQLGVPFDLTYSCYEGREKHCGLCPTCVNRREAFRQAQLPDPTAYEQ